MSSNLVLTLTVVSGMALVGGLVLVLAGARRSEPSLAEALALLVADRPEPVRGSAEAPRSERLGGWIARHSVIPLTARQRQLLELKNKPVAEFYADKIVTALLGAFVPLAIGTAALLLAHTALTIPALVGLLAAVGGWFVPDLTLRREGARARTDAGEALFTYFDLVTLERLANMSATQSLYAAATVSRTPLFALITAALDRARLEQRAPWSELRRLGEHLDLPELCDIADVMRLDETGAALAGALQARVRELRDAHLTRQRIAANEVSERMTVHMVVPAMVFGLIFLVPPLLRLSG